MSAAKPLVYFILGAAGSGRREVLADLIDGGLLEGDKAAVLLAAGEPASLADAKLPVAGRWTLSGGPHALGTIEAELPAGATHVFLIADGRGNPVDQIEAFADWLKSSGGALGRVLCVVDCALAEKQHAVVAWYEACLHFSDVALLGHRDGVANKWLSDFRERCEKQFRPCLFELIKAGRVKNPAMILDPQTRRVSHVLDEDQEWVVANSDEDGEDQEEGDEVEMAPEEDPYTARHTAGQRVKKIPDIAKYLDAPG